MPKPTLEQKVIALKKILRSMQLQYEHANGKMGRKSWKSVADFYYNQTRSLEDLLNDKGFLYGLLCDAEQPLKSAVADDNFSSAPSKKGTVSK